MRSTQLTRPAGVKTFKEDSKKCLSNKRLDCILPRTPENIEEGKYDKLK